MMNWNRSAIALAAAALLSANAWAGEGPAGHSHSHGHGESFSAGEPGDPKKPSKIVQVTMGEWDGKMLFAPARLEVKKGDQIKFVLRNNGESITSLSLQAPQTTSSTPKPCKRAPIWRMRNRTEDSSLRRRRARSSGNLPRPASSNIPV